MFLYFVVVIPLLSSSLFSGYVVHAHADAGQFVREGGHDTYWFYVLFCSYDVF